MKVLILGGGGREHALAWKISQSSLCSKVFASPGNPGIARLATCLPAPGAGAADFFRLAEDLDADLTIVGPEAPLVAGVVDEFRARGRRIIGPAAAAAQLEGSKVFSKHFLQRAGIPTAQFITAEDSRAARPVIGRYGYPVVLKADGLAAGKGVIIAQDEGEALAALARLPAGRLVIEECLRGEEVSFIAFTDGTRIVPLPATQDHKAVGDNDTGPNTGGMGAYCDGRILTEERSRVVMETIIFPTLDRMRAEGAPFTGFLYAGLMMTAEGPKVLEFNVRLGDPEAQALIHRMDSDLIAVLLGDENPRWKADPSVCVVLAAEGYPGAVRTGDTIHGVDACGATAFHSGTSIGPKGLATAGGRVLGVTSAGPDLSQAIANTYAAVERIQFDGMHYRRDIGRKGLKRW